MKAAVLSALLSTASAGVTYVYNHSDDSYNGLYFPGEDWYYEPHLVSEDGMHHFYWLDNDGDEQGYWQFDDRDQTGTVGDINDWYNGGYLATDKWGPIGEMEDGHQCFDFTMAGNVCFSSDFVRIDHPDGWYAGLYYRGADWYYEPHFTDGMGAHFYWLDNDGDDSGYWQFDNTDQTGTVGDIADLYSGGYWSGMQDDPQMEMAMNGGRGCFDFTSGNVCFWMVWLFVAHPDSWYEGIYWRDEDWYYEPHYTDFMGAHLYWLDNDGDDQGYWQFDNTDQTGTVGDIADLYSGGYLSGNQYDLANGMDDGCGCFDFTCGEVCMCAHDEMLPAVAAPHVQKKSSHGNYVAYGAAGSALLFGTYQLLKKRQDKQGLYF